MLGMKNRGHLFLSEIGFSAYSRLLRIIRAGCVSAIAIAEKLITGEMRRRSNKTKFYQTLDPHPGISWLVEARAEGNGQKDDRLFGQPLCCRGDRPPDRLR